MRIDTMRKTLNQKDSPLGERVANGLAQQGEPATRLASSSFSEGVRPLLPSAVPILLCASFPRLDVAATSSMLPTAPTNEALPATSPRCRG